MNQPVKKLGALLCASVLLLSGCTSLPRSTEPQALRSFEPVVPSVSDLGPAPGREADLLLRDFYSASARPVQDYQAARAYLTEDAASRWNASQSTLVVDRIDIITQAGATNERRSFDIRGSVVGELLPGGTYEPENGVYEATVEMQRDDGGEWRIASLPEGVLLERTELRNQYQPQKVFFPDSTGSVLVADRRWIHTGHEELDSALITLLMAGPSTNLSPAVNSLLPAGATFAGLIEGHYEFAGFQDMDVADRQLFAAQLVWTLASGNAQEPFRVLADGAPIIPGLEELSTDDFAEYNPQATALQTPALYALNNGVLNRLQSNAVEPVGGDLGQVGAITSVDVSVEGRVAAVRAGALGETAAGADAESTSTLLVGDISGEVYEVLDAETISRPSFERDSLAQWVVANGDQVLRVIRSSATGEFSQTEVDTSALESTVRGDISVLRLSHSGARVAMIADGNVYVAVVARTGPSQRSIVNVQELATQLRGTALSLDWQSDGSLVVGTSTPETPVWRVESDGSSVTTLPSGNLSAPVVAVAASASMIYLTDARALLQMPVSGADTTFWREVAGLQGVRAAPIVAN